MGKATPAEIEKILTVLDETPRRIHARTRGLSAEKLHFSPDKETWSISDTLAHLRSCADVWGHSIEKMLTEDNPTLPYHHPRQWIKKTNYPELAFHGSLQAFAAQGQKLLSVLRNLSLAEWPRAAIIKNREHTVFTQTRWMAKHESEHCGQIEELLIR